MGSWRPRAAQRYASSFDEKSPGEEETLYEQAGISSRGMPNMRRGWEAESAGTGLPSARYQAERDAGMKGAGIETSTTPRARKADRENLAFGVDWERDGRSTVASGASK